MILARDGIGVVIIPKCASESMKGVLKEEPYSRVVAFIRDPIERCISGYRFFRNKPSDPRYAPSWERWVEMVLSQDDGHWTPQARLVGDARLFPFELLSDVWRSLGWSELQVMNKSIYADVGDCAVLRDYYVDDFKLRARCGY